MVAEESPKLAKDTDKPVWWRVLLIGFILWVLSVVVTALTSNLNMIPTVVLLGSFLVPVTAVVWYIDHYSSESASPRHVLDALIVGGVLGVLAASVLEAWLLSDGVLLYLGVGLIEELVKLLALIVVARNLPRYTIRDGVVLGAAVGFGFAALESSGYALNALIVQVGQHVYLSLPGLVEAEFLRGILAPVGHGLWTAILGGILFGASRHGRLRITWGLVGGYLLVSLLHALWDSMHGIAIIVTTLLTTTHQQQLGLTGGQLPPPTPHQVATYLLVQFGGLIVVSLIGFIVLVITWRRGRPKVTEAANAA